MKLLQLDKVVQFKQTLGYSDDTSTVFITDINEKEAVTKQNALMHNTSEYALNSNFFIGSFEKTGILLLDISTLYKLTGAHTFIPYGAMQSLRFKKPTFAQATAGKSALSGMFLEMTLMDGTEKNFYVYKRMLISKKYAWVHDNFLRIQSLVNQKQIPIGQPLAAQKIERVNAKSKPVQQSQQLFCTNCGSRLDQGQRFCTHCGKSVSS